MTQNGSLGDGSKRLKGIKFLPCLLRTAVEGSLNRKIQRLDERRLLSQKSRTSSLEDQASEAPRGIGSSINADSIRQDLGLSLVGVSVHHDFAVKILRSEELLPNPD